VNDAVYLLPGRGHRLSDLGDLVGQLGFEGDGRELAPPFARLGFADLIDFIQRGQAVGLPDGKGTVKSAPRSACYKHPVQQGLSVTHAGARRGYAFGHPFL